MNNQLNSNEELAGLFHELSVFNKHFGKNPKAFVQFEKVAQSILAIEDDITVFVLNEQLDEIPGVDSNIAKDIIEFVSTGTISRIEAARKKFPAEFIDLLEFPGIGPKILKKIYDQLKISTRKELEEALADGSIEKIKGIGTAKSELILKAIEIRKSSLERIILWRAMKAGGKIIEWLHKSRDVKNIKICGSLRRKKELIRNIDVLVSCSADKRKKVIEHFTNRQIAEEVVVQDQNKASIILHGTGKHVKLHIIDEKEWGAAVVHYTGSAQHIDRLHTIADSKGYRLSPHGLIRLRDNKPMGGKTEEGIYKALGLQFVPPEMRENIGEIELAQKKQIPELIELSDIKGDMQMHTNWSDGSMSLEKLVRYVRKNFNYEYIVITDHSKSSGGLDEKGLIQQLKAIREINKKLGIDFVKYGVEVDVLNNGELDLSSEVLRRMDWVTASIHSGFDNDVTERLLRACEHPLVHSVTHPTGRIVGMKKPFRIDFNELLEAAFHTGTLLEINSQPLRMDLSDELAWKARERGVMLYISTDAHDAMDFYYMQLGVSIAKRAWCTKKDILNTRTWKEIGDLVAKKKARTPMKIIVK